MAMSNKLVAVFMVCIAVIAVMAIHRAEADTDDDLKTRFKECSKSCLDKCESKGHGNTFCEMKCDTRCGAKEAAAKLGINFNRD